MNTLKVSCFKEPNIYSTVVVHTIPEWYASCTVAQRESLQRVTRTAEKMIGRPPPSLDSRRLTRARATIKDYHHHPSHHLFSMLPSGRRFRIIRGETN